MPKPYTVLLGKTVRYIARLRGGGSALPGLFVERIDPHFVEETLSQLPHGIVLISGTNGKTTTTKMVVSLLESQGLKVFTNRTGSNFVRGVAAALLGEVDKKGNIDADIAVLELDEAHAVHFVNRIKPRYSLLLNVMRDQLDRFGEIDHTAKMLHTIASSTTDGVVINRDDPRIGSGAFVKDIDAQLRSFGVSPELLKQFPSDDNIRTDAADFDQASTLYADDTSLEKIDEQTATISYDGSDKEVTLKINGIYNILNAVGAVALCRLIMNEDLDEKKMLHALSSVTPAFGRGETLEVGGQPLELVLVKNPSGFRLGLQSFSPEGYATMITINDNYADGRDMSWLWDVDFDSLRAGGVAEISGVRAYDMALRMQYDEIDVSHVSTDLTKSLRHFIDKNSELPKRIYCTYTAMLALRRELAKLTAVEEVS
jgi:lipid II isoglutaminyl synthase (glutamine-hydrolysing)